MRPTRGPLPALFAIALAPACSSSPSTTSPSDASADRTHTATTSPYCPPVSELSACTPSPAATDCPNPGSGCTPDALPTGLACSGSAQCALPIFPCPQAEIGSPADGYVCTCVSGRWECNDCNPSAAICTDAGVLVDTDGSADAPADSLLDAPATDGAQPAFAIVTVVLLGDNALCLPQPLPATSTGETACAIVLGGLSTCGPGLTPATSAQVAALAARDAATGGPLCALPQVAASSTTSGCADPGAIGFCYVGGSCTAGDAASSCGEALCTTGAFNASYLPDGSLAPWTAWILCP